MENQQNNLTKFELDQNARDLVLNENIIRQILMIQGVSCACFLFTTLYLQFLWQLLIINIQLFTSTLEFSMVQNICGMSGIEVTLFAQRSILAIYFFTALFLCLIYYAVDNMKNLWIMYIKWPLLAYSLVVIIFAIVFFINAQNYEDKDVQNNWNTLSPLSKSWYKFEIQQLLDENIHNLELIGVYHLINGLFLTILFFLLFHLQYIMITIWRPQLKLRTSFEKKLLFRDIVKQQTKRQKSNDEYNELHKENEEINKNDPIENQSVSGKAQVSRFSKRPQQRIQEEDEPLSHKNKSDQDPFNISPEKADIRAQQPQQNQKRGGAQF